MREQRERRAVGRCECGTSLDQANVNGKCDGCTRERYYDLWHHRVSPEIGEFKALVFGCLMVLISCVPAYAVDTYINPDALCKAIYQAEGGAKTSHPYGIMKKYKTTSPKQACLNTVNSAFKRYKSEEVSSDFVSYLGKTYAPVGASNDSTGLNKNWVGNVSEVFYEA